MKQYKLLKSESVYSGVVFDVRLDTVVIPNGKTVTRDIVIHSGAVVIVPRSADGKFLMVQQYRHAVGHSMLEFPAGTLEIGEEPLACAKRELIEEVGHNAKNWQSLGTLYPAPGFANEVQHLFFATELTPDSAPGDEDEIIEVVSLGADEIKAAITGNQLMDAKSIAAFYRAELQIGNL